MNGKLDGVSQEGEVEQIGRDYSRIRLASTNTGPVFLAPVSEEQPHLNRYDFDINKLSALFFGRLKIWGA